MMTTEIRAGTVLGPGDRYRLERLLGAGGMASVWLAHDARLDRPVAVKILSDVLSLDSAFVIRFAREAALAARLSHPNLVEVFDAAAHGSRPYLVMELVEGGTLADRLREGRPASDVEPLARQLLAALAYVHEAGIVHRDIKPANILLGADGRARLTDFGIAQPTDATRITSTGFVLGTQHYAAPEILAGLPATERSDLYALGVLLGECAGGEGSPRLYALVDALTRSDPAARPQSAAAAAALLDADADAPTTWLPPRRPTVPAERTYVLPTAALAVTAPPPGTARAEQVRQFAASWAEERAHARLLRPRTRGRAATAAGGLALGVAALLLTAGAGAASAPAEQPPVPQLSRKATEKKPSTPLERRLDALAAAIDAAGRQGAAQ